MGGEHFTPFGIDIFVVVCGGSGSGSTHGVVVVCDFYSVVVWHVSWLQLPPHHL